MPGVVIGKTLNHGFPGTVAEMGDQLVKAIPNNGDATMSFGAAVFALTGGVATVGSTGLTPTAAIFKGVAIAQVKSANTYTAQGLGSYTAKQAVPVIERGAVSVQVNNTATNAPAVDGAVYIRVASGTTGKPLGGFEAAADSTNTIQLTNCCFGSTADSNGVATVVIKTRNNA
jgi:hypothetical protein